MCIHIISISICIICYMPYIMCTDIYIYICMCVCVCVCVRRLGKWHHLSRFNHKVFLPLYSKKLHIFTLRANTICVASLTILAFSLGGMVTNHLVNRTLPCRLTSSSQFIYYIPIL